MLKQIRKEKGLTQKEVAELFDISLRSYKDYENDERKKDSLKYKAMVEKLEKFVVLDEEHGVLTIDKIKMILEEVLKEENVKYCILFGSYSKGLANEKSDVDLLISTDITGLKFFGLAERLREGLNKKVDLIDLRQLRENQQLLDEILKDGIKVYEQR